MSTLHANCLPLLIGSLPVDSHRRAMEMILEHTPRIPLWPQLPVHRQEAMVAQFIPGMPAVDECDGTIFINGSAESFDSEFLAFYEEYLAISEAGDMPDDSRFALTRETAAGFFAFLEQTAGLGERLTALKGQTTGPFTFATGVVDHDNRAIFYNEQLKDAAVKHIALKARWQITRMKKICPRTIMIFDEPALAGFGSSAFITISSADVQSCLAEVFEAVRSEGALAGVHVCANTEWSLLFEAGADLVSFDAYSFFDKFILYPAHLRDFFARGGIVASGIVPTSPEFIDREDADSLTARWLEQTAQLCRLGIAEERVLRQTLITPSCGTGSIPLPYAERVMGLTRQVSDNIRRQFSLD